MRMFLTTTSWKSIADLLFYLQDFTIHNGDYPKEINMTIDGTNKYRRLLTPETAAKKTIKFMGIPIRHI